MTTMNTQQSHYTETIFCYYTLKAQKVIFFFSTILVNFRRNKNLK